VQGQASLVQPVQRHPVEGTRSQVLVDAYRLEKPTSYIEPTQPPVIPRPESTESAQSGGESPAAAPAEGDTQAPSLSDKDLDALARQVYAEIRKKLSVERERTRRR
jgi:spore germination cell wall hydrolase CwlJ-like protein